jgi:Ca2+-transporting ATPase
MDWPAVIKKLNTDSANGLSESEATKRLETVGRNELRSHGASNPWRILWEQFTELMVMLLIGAAIVSAFLGDYKDTVAIGAIVILNTLLGFRQEYSAEKALAALKRLAAPMVRVRRGGEISEIRASTLVPGDVILLESGNAVAADCRLLSSAGLQTHEAALTGESEPITKMTEAAPEAELPIANRRNMLYMGTFVTGGRGEAVVTETGVHTELGRLAELIQSVDRTPTPLQRRLNELGKKLTILTLFLVAGIFALGWLRGGEIKLLFLTAVSIAVAAVPEGLPAVVTIALSLGAQRMLKRRVLIRKLAAVETLGSVNVICTDKTGTLTEDRMTVAVVQTPSRVLDLRSDSASECEVARFRLLLTGAALCNDAHLTSSSDREIRAGDPTEQALVAAAHLFGIEKPEIEQIFPRVAEVPFSPERKRMTTVHSLSSDISLIPLESSIRRQRQVVFTKGAVESLLQLSEGVLADGRVEPLDPAWRDRLTREAETLATCGLRVLGVAFRGIDLTRDSAADLFEQNLIFVGMVGLMDPPRREASSALTKCKTAGIRTVMITGDHPGTAQHIAAQLGIGVGGAVVTGPQLERLSTAELQHIAESVQVYARVSPGDKLKIVEALQHDGNVVAMTGDGVNDGPALRKADIGVAMGVTGTDVAREAGDMILLDDNFATIVAAVEEGRVIYDNVRKFIRYILATNSGELWVMIAAPFFGLPLPLLPLQILWMNLMTDGLPALALGVEPAERDTMSRRPYRAVESIFARGMGVHAIWVGVLMALLSLSAAYSFWRAGNPNWQTLLFTTLTFAQMAHIMAIRSERQSLFQIGLLSNTPLLGSVSLTVLLQLAIIYVPFFQALFKTRPLTAIDLMLTIALSSTVFLAVEIEKMIKRNSARGLLAGLAV